MTTESPREPAPFESSRPWVIGAVLLCGIGTLGTVANASAPRGTVGRAPGFADVLRTNPGVVTGDQTAVVAVVTVAALAALWWSLRQSWPWLLVIGAVLPVPAGLAYAATSPMLIGDGAWFFQGSVTAAGQLVLLGTLGGGLRLVHIGAVGAGAILIGAGVGAQVFGAASDLWFARILLLPPGGGTDLASAVQVLMRTAMWAASIGGAFLVMVLHRRYGDRPELAGPSEPEPAPSRRVAVAGAVAALVFVPAAIPNGPAGGFTWHAYAVLLATGLAASLLAGVRAAGGTLVAGAVIVGISGPAFALIQAESDKPIRMWFLVAVGVVVGAAAAFASWRRWAAVAGCAACGVALGATLAIRPHGVTVLLLALLAATATAATASLGVWLAKDGLTPVVLGPLLFATVTGACGLLAHWHGTGRRGPTEELFHDPGHLWPYAALLLLAAPSIAVLHFRRQRPGTE